MPMHIVDTVYTDTQTQTSTSNHPYTITLATSLIIAVWRQHRLRSTNK